MNIPHQHETTGPLTALLRRTLLPVRNGNSGSRRYTAGVMEFPSLIPFQMEQISVSSTVSHQGIIDFFFQGISRSNPSEKK
ncbi:MAG TPA: hypothetical protein DCM07_16750 [Planctomycetaceae bacterium]|nr:hypothetical protein [Gimesia sp.]HAH46467.1 hypothetical protein [Planctomycetaceae bacterium]HBL47616.1 hypothetical protein [Planctomycetaceae bacterium]